MADEKTLTIAEAMAKVHEKLVQPKKDKENPFFKSKYVPLENVVEAIDNAIKGTGLAYMQLPFSTDNGVGVKTIVMTKDEKIESDLVLPSKKVDAQAYGSVITYARRYALSAFFGITSDEDDDGNEATQQTSGQASKRAKPNSNIGQRAAQSKQPKPKSENLAKVENMFSNLSKLLDADQAKQIGQSAAESVGAEKLGKANEEQLEKIYIEMQRVFMEKQQEIKK